MAVEITLTLPNQLYHQAEKLAQLRNWDVDMLLVEALEKSIGEDKALAEVVWAEPDEAVEREKAAYIAMHPVLLQKHPREHVAIYGGELIDHDGDFDALCSRIDEQYPDEFVWLAQVKEEPIETLVFRSPRFVRNDD